jgi:hypothetical protein
MNATTIRCFSRQAVPRKWLENGKRIEIERAAFLRAAFGRLESQVGSAESGNNSDARAQQAEGVVGAPASSNENPCAR